MLKQHSGTILSLLVLADACAVALAWVGSYWLRFHSGFLPIDPGKGVPDFYAEFVAILPVVVLAHLLAFYRVGLYRPRRGDSLRHELRDVFKAFIVAVIAVIVIDYASPRTYKISRLFVFTYGVCGTSAFGAFRLSLRLVLRELRKRGWNRRSAAIVGAGRNGQRLLHALRRNTWTGFEVAYFVDDCVREGRSEVRDVPVAGGIDDLARVVDERPVDCVFLALPASESARTDELIEELHTSMADVRWVPQVSPQHSMHAAVSQLDGVPILSLRQSPLVGWNAIVKRLFDLGVGGLCLVIAGVPMLLIAAAIKLTSKGPVFYRQLRTGLDGRPFRLWKFRTMTVDAEKDGPVWSQKEDARRTAVGALLRRTSLDELPNLFNVLAGELSLVGPRPERPEFIEQFKREIPGYMLRHKMKAGMTGFAQMRGWRGDTSLQKRIQHDLHYIRHWSLGLDVRILAMTVFGVWFSRHEG